MVKYKLFVVRCAFLHNDDNACWCYSLIVTLCCGIRVSELGVMYFFITISGRRKSGDGTLACQDFILPDQTSL